MKATGHGPHDTREVDIVWRPERLSATMLIAAYTGIVLMTAWLSRGLTRRRDARPVRNRTPLLVPPLKTSGTCAETKLCDDASVMAALAPLTGVEVFGVGANPYVRALLVEVLTSDGSRVVISRSELHRLFDGSFDEGLQRAFAPRLHVTELLEDAVEHLELHQLMGEAAHANPDIGPAHGTEQPTTYWIATPGHHDDVVLPLLRRAPWLIGVMFGEWRHGPTCAIDATGTITTMDGSGRLASLGRITTLGAAQALASLRSHALSAKGGR